MELYNNTLITDDLWDFIEANVPNYHERDDVMRQAQLQLLIDGHESPWPASRAKKPFCCVIISCTASSPRPSLSSPPNSL
ncbi:MAG: hypothetical protein ACLR1G_04125 [Alistipes indistinctus]